jgi:demethylmenaquinone methyltransferase/2-methoxy-6-polyprenyl-1,4-benzoquinol methylase
MQDAGFVRQAFAGIASRYVLANHVLSLGIDCLWRRATTAKRIAELEPQRILDLATGSGDLAQAIQSACPDAKVLGADFSVPMMREAQARRFRSLIAADGLELPFQDGVFRRAHGGLWPAQHGLLAGRPSGNEPCAAPRRTPVRPRFLHPAHSRASGSFICFILKNIMPRIAGWITGQRDAYVYLCGSIERFPSGKDMESLICANGFQSARMRRRSHSASLRFMKR